MKAEGRDYFFLDMYTPLYLLFVFGHTGSLLLQAGFLIAGSRGFSCWDTQALGAPAQELLLSGSRLSGLQ